MDRKELSGLVIGSITDIISENLKESETELATLSDSTRLIGREGVLDSLGLVSAIVDIEQKLSDDYAIEVTIADERAMSQEKSPFRTVGTLVEYISLLIKEQT